jgi:transposase
MMTRLPTQAFVAFVGIDWADTSHAVGLQVAGSDTRESRVLAHTPKAVHLARRTTLERFFRQHPVQTRLIAQRLQMITAAVPLTTDEGVITPQMSLVRALVARLRATLQAIEDVDRAIAPLASTPPDVALFHTLPGAGPVFAPRLLVAFGEPLANVS